MKGIYLENLAWKDAENLILENNHIVMLPIGARLKEHGHHLPLNNDWNMAEYLAKRITETNSVLTLPTLPFGYYPAFQNYPGSVHISIEPFVETICDIARSFARHGVRKIYVLNTGVSTNHGLEPARKILAAEGIIMEYTNFLNVLNPIESELLIQPKGTHADEGETSMMLYIQADTVDMSKAVREIPERIARGPFVRDKDQEGLYSPSGVFGDATLASREKGEILVEHLVKEVSHFLNEFSKNDFKVTPFEPQLMEIYSEKTGKGIY